MCSGHGCLFVCLSVPRRIPTILHGPGYNLGNGKECPLLVRYWADLKSVHWFRCYDNIAQMRNVSDFGHKVFLIRWLFSYI